MRIFIICLLLLTSGALSANPAPVSTKESTPMTAKQRAQAYYEQGYLYYMQGSYKLAVPEFLKTLKYNSKMTKARYWIAKSEYKLGNYRSVINQCDAALKMDPHNKDIRSVRKLATLKLAAQAPAKTAKTQKKDSRAAAPAKAPASETASAPVRPVSSVSVSESTAESAKPSPIQAPAHPAHTVSIDMRNVDISTVLQAFSGETGMSVLAGKDVFGKVSVILKDVPEDEALDMILKSNGFTYSRTGNVVQVFSSAEPSRTEELPGGVFVHTFQINYLEPSEISDTLAKLMPAGSQIYTTKGSNGIVVKGSASDIKRAEIIISNIDIPPRQVMVEAKIIEISLGADQLIGMTHSYTNPNNATENVQTVALAQSPSSTGAIGMYYTVTNQNLSSLVEAYSTRTGFNILSSPKVMALNNQQADILTGQSFGYNVNTVTPTGTVQNVVFMDVGTRLTITPSIKSDGNIVMQIHPEISDGAIVNALPQKNSTETTTQLIVKDGQTIIIGGLVRDTTQKEVQGVPILMDIPIVGMLFKRTEITSDKKEIIVLITPHIVTADLINQMGNKIDDFENTRHNNSDINPVAPIDLAR